jgi:hypothetical protein
MRTCAERKWIEMNKVHQKRLLNVAKALRESANPEAFTMEWFVHGDTEQRDQGRVSPFSCGTPACAIGHYAARRDLQRELKIVVREGDAEVVDSRRLPATCWSVHEHFGVTPDESRDLFAYAGCGGAKTPKAAARYIERFVARKVKEASK